MDYEGIGEERRPVTPKARGIFVVGILLLGCFAFMSGEHQTADLAKEPVTLVNYQEKAPVSLVNYQNDPIPNTDNGLPKASQINKAKFPGYPQCSDRIDWMVQNWNATEADKALYGEAGVDGSIASIMGYLNNNGLYCPAYTDAAAPPIRGVNLGGWLVLEPWIKPSLFEQFDPSQGVKDQYTFCQALGKDECKRQLIEHWSTWVTEEDVKDLSEGGITHVRIPVGYWIFGDILESEPWVNGALVYLQRAMHWFKRYNLKVIFDLHCGPGSQNGFDNSGRMGPIH